MYRIKNPQTQEDVIVYELCDKEYKTIRPNNRVNRSHYPMLPFYMRSLKTSKEETTPIPTCIEELDKLIDGGLQPGLYIFGANPALGKTSLMLHIALNLATTKHHCLYFNLEMSAFRITTRLLANCSYRESLTKDNYSIMSISKLSKKSLYNDKTNKFNDKLKSLYDSYQDIISDYLHFINYTDDNDCRSIDSIKISLENCKVCHSMTPVVIIDFLQLLKLQPSYGYDNEVTNSTILSDKRLETNEIIEQLQKLSKKYKVPILAISSLSRGGYTKDNAELTDYAMSAFKESGSIEYTADFLALLTRGDDNINFGSADTKTVYINVLKNRYGKPDVKIPLEFIPEYSYFKDIKDDYEEGDYEDD